MKRNNKIKHLIRYVHYGAMIFQNIQADIQNEYLVSLQ